MKVATVLLSSEPLSMIRRHRGMISVVRRKLITCSSVFTRAPIFAEGGGQPKYSKGLSLAHRVPGRDTDRERDVGNQKRRPGVCVEATHWRARRCRPCWTGGMSARVRVEWPDRC